MFFLQKITLALLLLFLIGCNKNLSENEKKEMWSKAQTSGEIINRSGTVFNPTNNKPLAMMDAQTRLQTGGGLLSKEGGIKLFGNDQEKQQSYSTMGMPINPYLWKASLEVIDFMPLSSVDPIGGTIITDWYTVENNDDERCKLNIFINGAELKTQNLKVSSFCQIYKNQRWVNKELKKENNTKLENAILNQAKKIKLKLG